MPNSRDEKATVPTGRVTDPERVLVVTNMYPTATRPASGTFVEGQVASLRARGLDVQVEIVDRAGGGMRVYRDVGRRVRTEAANHEIVHVMYGGVMADEVTRALASSHWPGATVVSFCGSDLLGQTGAGPVRKAASSYGVLASRRAAQRADAIVVKARVLAAALPRRVPFGKVHVIPNGVDLDRFRPLDRAACRAALHWGPADLHVLFAASGHDPTKRRDLAVAAVQEADRRGRSCQLHVLEGVPHEVVPQWLNAADAVLVTSAHEGSPNIVKEALACEIPIVSVDVGDVRERISGIEGCHVTAALPGALADALTSVANGPKRVASRERMKDLSLEAAAARLSAVYSAALSDRRRTVAS